MEERCIVLLDRTEEAEATAAQGKGGKTEGCSAPLISLQLKATLPPPIWLHSAQKVWQPVPVLPEPSRTICNQHPDTSPHVKPEQPGKVHILGAHVCLPPTGTGDITRFMFLRGPLTPVSSLLGPSDFPSPLRFPPALQTPRTSSEVAALAKREEDDSIG